MLHLGIDQHIEHINASLRDDSGEILRSELVSTRPNRIHAFFQRLTDELLQADEAFVALLEVFEFNDWLIRMLDNYGCQQIILIKPLEGKNSFKNRREADELSELLWVYRNHLLTGKQIISIRQVDLSSTTELDSHKLTRLRKQNIQARTDTVNQIKHLLQCHNLQWELPTTSFPSKTAIAWLKEVMLSKLDRLEMDYLLADLEYFQHRLTGLEGVIAVELNHKLVWSNGGDQPD